MQQFPHHYHVAAAAHADSNVELTSAGVAPIESAAPVEFGGPGDRWSPESLLVASVADCFILSFKAIARGSKLEWLSLGCSVEGVLDKVDKVTQFTEFHIKARLTLPAGSDAAKGERLLNRAEHSCLITNSLTADSFLTTEVSVDE